MDGWKDAVTGACGRAYRVLRVRTGRWVLRFAGAVGKPFPSTNVAPRDRSPGEALGGTYEHLAVHWGEVIARIADIRA